VARIVLFPRDLERVEIYVTTTTNEKIVFTRGVPPPEAFPADELAECFAAAVHEDTAVVLQYGNQSGYAPLREELAREYGVSPAEVMVGNGSLQLQDLVSAHLVRPGMTVYTEQPSYDRAITTFRRRGARTVGIPLEDDGISTDRLEEALKREVPAFLYLVPDFQNPAGATLSLEKRRKVVELANEYGFKVIEDVPYRKLRYEGEDLPMLREIDATQPWHPGRLHACLRRVGACRYPTRGRHIPSARPANTSGGRRVFEAWMAGSKHREAKRAICSPVEGDVRCRA
jgi:DNA-binding transcriptional MocR family regulator